MAFGTRFDTPGRRSVVIFVDIRNLHWLILESEIAQLSQVKEYELGGGVEVRVRKRKRLMPNATGLLLSDYVPLYRHDGAISSVDQIGPNSKVSQACYSSNPVMQSMLKPSDHEVSFNHNILSLSKMLRQTTTCYDHNMLKKSQHRPYQPASGPSAIPSTLPWFLLVSPVEEPSSDSH